MINETGSLMCSPISVSGVESILDVDSTISVGGVEVPALDTIESSEDALFDPGDGDIRLMVNGTSLEAHKYIIKRFARLKNRIQNNTITFGSDETGVQDFRNTFKILYASVVEGPFEFDHPTLTSALRIATVYDYPALRQFSIEQLEKTTLCAVERIRLARDFELPSWEEPAYVELCGREEAITKEEANVLGMDALVHVARIREKEQRRKGKEVDAIVGAGSSEKGEERKVGGLQDDKKENCQQTGSASTDPKVVEPKKPSRTVALAATKSGWGWGGISDLVNKAQDANKPDFMGVQTLDLYPHNSKPNKIEIGVPGCSCKASYHEQGNSPTSKSETVSCQCKLPPCAVKAFKTLQTQRLAHNTSISNLKTSTSKLETGISKLETTIEKIQTTLSSLTSAPEPGVGLDSKEPDQIKSVQEEVRKWLASVENHNATA